MAIWLLIWAALPMVTGALTASPRTVAFWPMVYMAFGTYAFLTEGANYDMPGAGLKFGAVAAGVAVAGWGLGRLLRSALRPGARHG